MNDPTILKHLKEIEGLRVKNVEEGTDNILILFEDNKIIKLELYEDYDCWGIHVVDKVTDRDLHDLEIIGEDELRSRQQGRQVLRHQTQEDGERRQLAILKAKYEGKS